MSKMTHISSDSFQAWRTPRPLGRHLVVEYECGLDAAADAENALCTTYYDEEVDGLDQKWFGNVWLNCPFNAIPVWLAKAEAEVAAGNCNRVTMLVPASVGTGWFTRAMSDHEIHLFDKRIRFELPQWRIDELLAQGKKISGPGWGAALVIIERDGLVGVTAMRDSLTGRMLHDFTEDVR